MKIFDVKNKHELTDIGIYLTFEEAKHMSDSLENLIKGFKKKATHSHFNDANYEKEITLIIYDRDELSGLDEASIQLIKDDK